MLEIDAFFRPAAVTLALLTAFLLLRDARFDFRARLGALFGIGTAAYMSCSGASSVSGAEALLLPLMVVRYEGVIGSYLGETASRVARLFDYVRTRQCVLKS